MDKMAEKKKSPEIRFAGFTGEWEEDYLDQEAEFFTGLTYTPNDVISKGGTFVIRSSNIKNGEFKFFY